MRRAILVVLGTMTLVSSAAAIRFSVGADVETGLGTPAARLLHPSLATQSARAMQRERIEMRYLSERARCEPLGGVRRDECLIAAHALKGRALLESAAPYGAGT